MTDTQRTDDAVELRECPFCGAMLEGGIDLGSVHVHPENACLLGGRVIADIAAWNRRPTEQAESQSGEEVQWMARKLHAADFLSRWPDHDEQTASLAYDTFADMPLSGAGFVEQWERLARAALSASPATQPVDVRAQALEEALTPSVATKAAYMGEFSFDTREIDEFGDERRCKVYVPWDTIKQIMAGIREHAAAIRALKLSAPAQTQEVGR